MIGTVTTKSTLCGLAATRYVDVFDPSEASCRECRKRWQLAAAEEQVWAESDRQRQRLRGDISVLSRTAQDALDAGGSAYAAVKYESEADQWRRKYLFWHPMLARRLFPNGVPERLVGE